VDLRNDPKAYKRWSKANVLVLSSRTINCLQNKLRSNREVYEALMNEQQGCEQEMEGFTPR